MKPVLKRYCALIRDTRYFEIVVAAHDEEEAFALAETFSQEGDLAPYDIFDGDVSVEQVDECCSDDDRVPAAIAWAKPEVAS